MTRDWTETEPEKGLTSDDAQKMYQCVCRAAGFDFLRLRFPYLLAVFRFFYYHAPVIWFGGAVLWVLTSASGVSTLASPSTPGAQKLVSAEGGIQGDGGATLLAIGPFHELLSRVQRAHPDIAMTGIADDTYSCGLLTPGADGAPAPLFAFADTKRRLCKSELNIDSNPSKCLVYSRSGDLSAAPTDMPGSPNFVHADPETQLRGRKPVLAFKVAGALVGDDAECSRRLCEEIAARLAPLEYLVSMRDHENVPNARCIALHTARLVAASIPYHWMRCMPPNQTAAAAAHADHVIADAIMRILGAGDSPADRVELATATATMPSEGYGGVDIPRFSAIHASCYAASICACWTTCRRINPLLPAIGTALDADAPASLAAFGHAWTVLQQSLGRLRAKHQTHASNTRT